ncbi:Wzz/FepE/Etk N-terminal domain-containing protein [Roseicyclus sp.]|uniref:Wzz/FepE/Etk N-terminal domain-containing protein n=1 Tax=Roseicyclus sp. TaxID=1914329 RepID=UPI003F9F4383
MNQSFGPRRGFGADFNAEPAGPRPEEALAELLLAMRRQAFVVALGAVFGLGLGLVHYATSPRTYEAAATLLIEEQQSELAQEISAALPTSRSDTGMMNEMQILRSLEVATQVVAALDLDRNPDFLAPPSSLLSHTLRGAKDAVRALIPRPAPPAAGPVDEALAAERRRLQTAEQLRNATVFTRVGRSFVVEIWFSSSDPALAADIVNAYAEAYLGDRIHANVAAADRTAGWMEARLEELRQDALAAAAEAERFRLEVGATDQQGLRDREQRAEALNDLVLRFQSRYRELSLESTYPVSAGRILSVALPPRDPATPRAWQVLAAGLFLGMMLGVAAAVLREARETGFRTAGDVTATLGLPFMGYVPKARGRGLLGRLGARGAAALGAGRKRSARRGLPARHLAEPTPEDAAATATPGGREAALFLGLSHAATARAVRNIFANIDMGHDARGGGRLVAVGALTAGEGTTPLAAHLALVAAQAGRRCLLADGDLEAGTLTRRLGLGAAPGTLDVLEGRETLAATLAQGPGAEIDVLPTGTGHDMPAPLSFMPEFGELIGDLCESYDYVFIDLPPLTEAPEVKGLLRHFDVLLLAAAWGRTPRKLLQSYLEHEPELRRRVFGVVLTRVRLRRLPRYGVPLPARGREPWGALL